MKIVADQNIPLLTELFADLGEVVALPGRELGAGDIGNADILLVRSVTTVNQSLLKNSGVKFVGTCTIGTDHLDTDFLAQQSITWASAPGCNANAVVQYVFSAMAFAQPDWLQATVGIIGWGNIGRRLYQRLTALGVRCRVYDPLLTAAHCPGLTTLAQVLACDIITCHTPLTTSGPFPTYHLLGEQQLQTINPGALLINSGRGAVIDNQALANYLSQKSVTVVLDVWEPEPAIDRQLLQQVTLGTPHIAGYSVEGKEQGSWQIYEALSQFLQQPIDPDKNHYLTCSKSIIDTIDTDQSLPQQLNQLLLRCYPITDDDQALRQQMDFDRLRKYYPYRREYTGFELSRSLQAGPLAHYFSIISGSARAC